MVGICYEAEEQLFKMCFSVGHHTFSKISKINVRSSNYIVVHVFMELDMALGLSNI